DGFYDHPRDRAPVRLRCLREDRAAHLTGVGRRHARALVLEIREPHPIEQRVPRLRAERLRVPAVMELGRVHAFEAELDASVALRRLDAVAVSELEEELQVVGDEANRGAVGLLADDYERTF